MTATAVASGICNSICSLVYANLRSSFEAGDKNFFTSHPTSISANTGHYFLLVAGRFATINNIPCAAQFNLKLFH